jgi:hypothetical protein
MSKVQITYADWQKLEKALMDARVGYSVIFDDHHGVAEMVIGIQHIGVMRWEDNEGPGVADWAVSETKPVTIEEGI